MTNQEAIEVLKNDIEICTFQQKEACDMAIKALEVVKGIEDAYMRELLKTPLERDVPVSDACDGCRYELNSTNGNPCYSCGKYKLTECADLLNMPLGHSCEDCFTDDEKRMFLTSLAREMKICEQVDIECPNAKIKLVPIIHSIQEKVLRSSLWKGVEE